MDWDNITFDVFFFYIKLGFVFVAYHFTKYYIVSKRTSVNPPVIERLWPYALCIIVVSFIGVIAASQSSDSRGARVFLILLVPVLFGAHDGFKTDINPYILRRE